MEYLSFPQHKRKESGTESTCTEKFSGRESAVERSKRWMENFDFRKNV